MSDNWHSSETNIKTIEDIYENKRILTMMSIISIIVKKDFKTWCNFVEKEIKEKGKNLWIKNKVLEKGHNEELVN